MAYINEVQIKDVGASTFSPYLIEPTLYIKPILNEGIYSYTNNSSSIKNFELVDGVAIQAQFAITNPLNATLNVNNKGAKPIYYGNSAITENLLTANHIYTLVYDSANSGRWNIVGDIDTDTNTYRQINVNDTCILTTSSTTALNLKAGDYISLSNNGGTVTINNTLTAADLGLSHALRFVGQTTSNMSENFTDIPENININYIPMIGDVVLDSNGNGEYVCIAINTVENTNSYVWEYLGAESSFKIKQTAISDPSVPSEGTTTATAFIDSISQDVEGVITVTKKNLPEATSDIAGIVTLGASGGAATYSHTHTLSIAKDTTGTNKLTLEAGEKYK